MRKQIEAALFPCCNFLYFEFRFEKDLKRRGVLGAKINRNRLKRDGGFPRIPRELII